jgi:thymidine kinase
MQSTCAAIVTKSIIFVCALSSPISYAFAHTFTIGSLEVICGPMFSGKSEELIRRLRRAAIAKQEIAVFKPILDNRYKKNEVVSHNGIYIQALAVASSQELYELACDDAIQVVGIDEVQFFDHDIVEVINTLIRLKKRVIVAGLDLDFRGLPFEPMPTLLAIADDVSKLKAICTYCGNNANLSQRLINGIPAQADDPLIVVGAQNSYQARCRKCFETGIQSSCVTMPTP